MPTYRLQEAVRLLRVSSARLQAVVGLRRMVLVMTIDEPPRARRLLCNGYNVLSTRSEAALQWLQSAVRALCDG